MFRVHLRKPVKDKDNIVFLREPTNFLAVKAANLMLTFLGLKVSYETLAFLALFLVSEVVGNSKLKENSIVQLLLNAVNSLKPLRSEDDKIAKFKDSILK
jgi:hypothetical protein